MAERIDSFDGPYRFLSNFFPLTPQILVDGIYYRTVEHAFQAQKTLNETERIWICNAVTPGMAKRIGRTVTLRSDWGEYRLPLMGRLLRQKFSDPVLRDALIETGDAELTEGNTWGDRFWGVDGIGENHLGKLLMKLRDEYTSQTKETRAASEAAGSGD